MTCCLCCKCFLIKHSHCCEHLSRQSHILIKKLVMFYPCFDFLRPLDGKGKLKRAASSLNLQKCSVVSHVVWIFKFDTNKEYFLWINLFPLNPKFYCCWCNFLFWFHQSDFQSGPETALLMAKMYNKSYFIFLTNKL